MWMLSKSVWFEKTHDEMMIVWYYYSDNFMSYKHCWNTHYLKGLDVET
jgi:hypothetical protein